MSKSIEPEENYDDVLLGYKNNKLFTVKSSLLNHHTLIVGQSGSGKSRFATRCIEEILCRTTSRVVIFDPNGDYRLFRNISNTAFSDDRNIERFVKLDKLCEQCNYRNFDRLSYFKKRWQEIIFSNLELPSYNNNSDDAVKSLFQNNFFKYLHISLQDIPNYEQCVFGTDPISYPLLAVGINSCLDEHSSRVQKNTANRLNSIVELEKIASQFYTKSINMDSYPFAKQLTDTDWIKVGIHFLRVRLKHRSLFQFDDLMQSKGLPLMISDHFNIPATVPNEQERKRTWRCTSLGLDLEETEDIQLLASAALKIIWDGARERFRRLRFEQLQVKNEKREVERIFLVIDESQNFVPKDPVSFLQKQISQQLLQIASEGRKYGLFLILITQRPTKLHPSIVPECENTALLRLKAPAEKFFANQHLGVPEDELSSLQKLLSTQSLLHGEWTDNNTSIIEIAPPRSYISG